MQAHFALLDPRPVLAEDPPETTFTSFFLLITDLATFVFCWEHASFPDQTNAACCCNIESLSALLTQSTHILLYYVKAVESV